VYYAVGKLGLHFALIHASTSAIWPATGLAFAMLLLWGILFLARDLRRRISRQYHHRYSVAERVLIATGHPQAVSGACAAKQGSGLSSKKRHHCAVLFLVRMAATALSATIGVTSHCLTGAAAWPNFSALWGSGGWATPSADFSAPGWCSSGRRGRRYDGATAHVARNGGRVRAGCRRHHSCLTELFANKVSTFCRR
jgi:hypothetical protein